MQKLPQAQKSPTGDTRDIVSPRSLNPMDWIMTLLSFWLLGGLFLDGWAHHTLSDLETFFTPWHGVLYSGMLAVAVFLIGALARNSFRGTPLKESLPMSYQLSLVGVLLFLLAGAGDIAWHFVFGVEDNIEALISPTHLVLALGGALIVSGPLRSIWHRSLVESNWTSLLPALLSLTYLLSIFTFFTHFAYPLTDTWATADTIASRTINMTDAQSIGVVSILLQTGLMMGLILLAVRRWELPVGSLTLIFTLNATLMTLMESASQLIPVAVAAGIIADLLLWQLRPSVSRRNAFRIFAFAVPIVFFGAYFAFLMLTESVVWSVPMWSGSMVLAGVAGLLISYLVVLPVNERQRVN